MNVSAYCYFTFVAMVFVLSLFTSYTEGRNQELIFPRLSTQQKQEELKNSVILSGYGRESESENLLKGGIKRVVRSVLIYDPLPKCKEGEKRTKHGICRKLPE